VGAGGARRQLRPRAAAAARAMRCAPLRALPHARLPLQAGWHPSVPAHARSAAAPALCRAARLQPGCAAGLCAAQGCVGAVAVELVLSCVALVQSPLAGSVRVHGRGRGRGRWRGGRAGPGGRASQGAPASRLLAAGCGRRPGPLSGPLRSLAGCAAAQSPHGPRGCIPNTCSVGHLPQGRDTE